MKLVCKRVIGRLLEEGKRWGYLETDVYLGVIPQPVDIAMIPSYQQLNQWMMQILDNSKASIKFYRGSEHGSPKIADALSYIHQNFVNPISLDTVSEAVGLNEAYLSRIFKEETGKGMMEYIKEIRIQKAKRLLEVSSFRIKDICIMCGFNDYGYFIRAFKGVVGKTPVQYRENK